MLRRAALEAKLPPALPGPWCHGQPSTFHASSLQIRSYSGIKASKIPSYSEKPPFECLDLLEVG